MDLVSLESIYRLKGEFLNPSHKEIIQHFDCSDEPSVEQFLKEKALYLQSLGSAVTHLYFDEYQNLIGYFTLYNGEVVVGKEKRRKENWKLPKGRQNRFPAIYIHYLGVDRRFRKLGYGACLLVEAIINCLVVSRLSGCNFIVLEALPKSVGFYKRFGFTRLATNGDIITMALKIDELEEFFDDVTKMMNKTPG